ncbi:hypothetical protein Tco_1070087 [Tanacetum coccineum]|uniref:Uncharacterized protein n=1 Tax=Tanacetum coccineum TaxID=301880 RepID=A0ABQ5HKE6_9ASTR
MHFLQPALAERPLKFAVHPRGITGWVNGGRKLCTIMDTLTQWEPHSMLAATFSGRHTACKDILYSSLLVTHKTSNNKDNQSVGVGVNKVDPNKRVPTHLSGLSLEFLEEHFRLRPSRPRKVLSMVERGLRLSSPIENIDDIAKAEFYNPQARQVAEKEKHDTLLLEGNLAAIEAKQMDARKAKRAKFVV